MIRELVLALRACAVTFVLCAVAYPAVVWGVAQLLFPSQAEGSLIYGADGTNGDRLGADRSTIRVGPLLPPAALGRRLQGGRGRRLEPGDEQSRLAQGDRQPGSRRSRRRRTSPVPVDLVTASGSGLDPDISPEAALYQAPRVAADARPADREGPRPDRSRDRSDRERSWAPAAGQCAALEPGARSGARRGHR